MGVYFNSTVHCSRCFSTWGHFLSLLCPWSLGWMGEQIIYQLILVSHFTCTPSSYYHLQSLQITLSVTTEYILLSGHRSISIYRLKPVLSDPLRYVHNKEPHNSQLDWVNIPFLCRHLVTPIYLVRTYNASLS